MPNPDSMVNKITDLHQILKNQPGSQGQISLPGLASVAPQMQGTFGQGGLPMMGQAQLPQMQSLGLSQNQQTQGQINPMGQLPSIGGGQGVQA